MGHEAQVFPTKRCQSWPGCGRKEARLLAVHRPETTLELLRASLGLNRPSSGGCLRSGVGGGCRVAQRRTWQEEAVVLGLVGLTEQPSWAAGVWVEGQQHLLVVTEGAK